MLTRPKAKSSYLDESQREKLQLNFRSISKARDLDLLNCIGEEAKVDSAKTEESKYWFPSHARKRSENAGSEITANNTPGPTTFYQKKNNKTPIRSFG